MFFYTFEQSFGSFFHPLTLAVKVWVGGMEGGYLVHSPAGLCPPSSWLGMEDKGTWDKGMGSKG